MDKRYQVFVSSTYADLQHERQHVIQTLMEMDCIPAGMELFPAADEEQWQFIKKVIDDCDYYLLIVGNRYGSLAPDGLSYTEKEFDYAQSKGLKTLAFLHEDPGNLPANQADADTSLAPKLNAFRNKIKTGRLIKFWNTAEQLPGLVSLSLAKTIKLHPAEGWIRASHAASTDILGEINTLRKDNAELQQKLARLLTKPAEHIKDLAGLDDEIELHVDSRYRDHKKRWEITISWRDIFSAISPYLASHPGHAIVKNHLRDELVRRKKHGYTIHHLDNQDFETVGIQLKAMNLVSINYSKSTKGVMGLFWSLTKSGERLMYELRTQRTANASDDENV